MDVVANGRGPLDHGNSKSALSQEWSEELCNVIIFGETANPALHLWLLDSEGSPQLQLVCSWNVCVLASIRQKTSFETI